MKKICISKEWEFSSPEQQCPVKLDLPHDYSISLPRNPQSRGGGSNGFFEGKCGKYEKYLNIGSDEHIILDIDGAYMCSRVRFNNNHMAFHPYGYTPFLVDLTSKVRKNRPNKIEIITQNLQPSTRWYSGSGIYRNVWLVTTDKTYIDDWSIAVSTPDTHHVNLTATVVLPDGSTRPYQQTIEVENPRLWSPEDPYLYHTELTIPEGDRITVTYGIRTIEYSAEKGLFLNGKSINLNGACVHHDNGILGAAAFDDAEYRKARLMKEAGFNAVRTSHNPPSEAFLRACDEIGLLVIDEAFDGWREKKNTNDYDYSTLFDQWWKKDIDAMVLRDRLHPSIFCWSTGNEVIERKKIEIIKTAHQLASRIHEIDPQNRPVTSALAAWDRDWDIYDPLAAEHDIVGYNYMIFKAESDHERVPNRVMMQTESYPRDAWRNYQTVQKHDYILGDFVWTGLDYIGESGIGRYYYEGDVPGESWERPLYPWHAAYCGDVDLTGERKPISYYRSMLWNGGQTHLAVREPDGYIGKVKTSMWSTWPTQHSWTWPNWEGKPIEVEVYSRQPKVSLYLNDQLIGEQETKEMKATFKLTYQPGTLRAEAGNERSEIQTAGAVKTIRLKAENYKDLSFITAEIIDAQGRVVPASDTELTFAATGVTFLAAGNADIKDDDPYFDTKHRTWHGRCLAVVSKNGKKGTLSVSAKGLPTAKIAIK